VQQGKNDGITGTTSGIDSGYTFDRKAKIEECAALSAVNFCVLLSSYEMLEGLVPVQCHRFYSIHKFMDDLDSTFSLPLI